MVSGISQGAPTFHDLCFMEVGGMTNITVVWESISVIHLAVYEVVAGLLHFNCSADKGDTASSRSVIVLFPVSDFLVIT